MPSDFTVDIKCDFVIPDFLNATVPLTQISEAVANDCRKNIRQSTDFETGSPLAKLARKTINDKKRLGYGGKPPLERTGVMLNAIHAYKVVNNVAVVGIIPRGNPSRDLLGIIHQEQGVNKFTRVIRRFMGISPQRQEWIDARMSRWINERLQKASHKYLNLKV